jgi:hypothetical protein
MRYGLIVKGNANRDGLECSYCGRTAKVKIFSGGVYLEWYEGTEKKIASNARNFKLQVDLIEVQKKIKTVEGSLKAFYQNAANGIEYKLGMREWI